MIEENFETYFSTDLLATTAQYYRKGRKPEAITINGILNKEYVEDDGSFNGTEGNVPVFHCATSSVPEVKQGDRLIVDGEDYRVINHRPDGTGESLLYLEEQQ